MAIYHFSAKIISRANGSSALAAAAYRSASRLHDERLDRRHDFSNKPGVVHSEVLLPDGAPDAWRNRQQLWNAVEATELRKDAQLAREIEFALPRELTKADAIELAREFVKREFVARGMIADLNVHWDVGADGLAKPHAHVMLTTRSVGEDGFGPKVRDWNRTDLLEHWRERWAEHVNTRLAERDIDACVDHRSLSAQGIDLEPQHKIGPAAARMAGQGLASERLDEHHAIARSNGDKLIANPALALDAITHGQATFTTRDLAMFVHCHSEGKEQFDLVMAAVRASPELVALGKDGRGNERFTSRDMLETERRLERATERLNSSRRHGVGEQQRTAVLARAATRGLTLSAEQRSAFEHVTKPHAISSVVGYAGTGKSAMLGVARDAWEHAGYAVRGAALSGIAAENLEAGSGIASRTIASLEHQWGQGRELLTPHDVLVIDEAGMIGTRQMERVIAEVEKRGAKIVLVGDPEQLQAIEAGAAFRSIAERHGSIEITDIRRQRDDWQRTATRHLATERTGEAIAAYRDQGAVQVAATRNHARADLIDRWDRERVAQPGASRLILTYTNDEVQALNLAARDRLRAAAALGPDVTLSVEKGSRAFAPGDRVMFGRNERSLGVKNGSLGQIESVSAARMAVLLDDGRAVAFDLKEYAAVDHGYAATIHKSQGVTVDRVHVLATPGLDRHGAYVALSRHRDGVSLHYGQDDFADEGMLVRTLSRERSKDMASDYVREFAHQRQIRLPEPVAKEVKPSPVRDPFAGLDLRSAVRPPTRGMFDGLRLRVSDPAISAVHPSHDLGDAVRRYVVAFAEVDDAERVGREPMPHQRTALEKATERLDRAQRDGARELRSALLRNPDVISDVKQGRTTLAIQAMTLERELRADPVRRADRFVDDWHKLNNHLVACERGDKFSAARQVTQQMVTMAKSLERDPQLESLVRNRIRELGIQSAGGMSMSQSLQRWLSLSRGRGLGR